VINCAFSNVELLRRLKLHRLVGLLLAKAAMLVTTADTATDLRGGGPLTGRLVA